MKTSIMFLSLLFLATYSLAASDAVRVGGDLKVDGIHFSKDGSTINSSDDLLKNKGAWTSSVLYSVGDIVQVQSGSYFCVTANTDTSPPNAQYWSPLGGVAGPVGPAGPPNNLTIGTVANGTLAAAIITGTAPSQILNLTLPQGAKGDKGEPGSGLVCANEKWIMVRESYSYIYSGAMTVHNKSFFYDETTGVTSGYFGTRQNQTRMMTYKEYDNKNNPTLCEVYYSGSNEVYYDHVSNFYDINNKLTSQSIVTKDKNDMVVWGTVYNYDVNGNIVSEIWKNNDGTIADTLTYTNTLNSYGKMIKSVISHTDTNATNHVGFYQYKKLCL